MMTSELSEAERTPSGNKELEHDVESEVAEETMSTTMKLAKEIDEPYDIDLPTAECQSRTPSEKKAGYTQRRCIARKERRGTKPRSVP